ncbi:GNAT family N-acetyltransferase [Peribacillus sp. FSL K6-1552]|uniref:GNAT family N-acetyltransferase n=1 Tax=Peribacillus sp. FSL K6-1552 TaxID=2954514 RepID=UPI0030F9F796
MCSIYIQIYILNTLRENVKEVFKSLVNNESFIFLLLEDNEEALGYAWIEIREYIHQISIVETKRNKGYGSSLMECIYEIANDRGIDLIELDDWFENSVA